MSQRINLSVWHRQTLKLMRWLIEYCGYPGLTNAQFPATFSKQYHK